VTLATLALRDIRRSPLRLSLTILAVGIGVLAFVFLQTVIDLWYSGVEAAQPDRLAVRSKTSLTQPLPLSYMRRIAAVPGVDRVTFGGWFGGRLGESRRDFFPNFYADEETYLQVYDELVTPEADVAAWKADPCGALIGRQLAKRFGWKRGDRISLQGTIYPGTWDFTVRGVYDGKTRNVDTTLLIFGYRCLNERVEAARKDLVGYYAVRIDDPSRSASVATGIDALFANSAYETKTESERSFQLGFVAMSASILAAVRIISYVILGIILLVVANTIAMGVRERTVDFATIMALGFRRRHVVALVLAESALIGAAGAALGLAGSPLAVRAFGRLVAQSFGSFPEPVLSVTTLVLSTAAALAVGLLAGALPAVRASRLIVAEGLRRVA
jgi:putative ABC transport system permease protein